MSKKNILVLIALIFIKSRSAHCQSTPTKQNEVNIDLTEFCKDEEEKISMPGQCVLKKEEPNKINSFQDQLAPIVKTISGYESPDKSKANTCKTINEMSNSKAPPIEMQMDDDKGDHWKIRFHFGFTRTNIRPADVTIDSSLIKTEITDFQFGERTNVESYNPATWQHLQDAARWIDEPSNTMTLSIENKHNAFYITAFHPKFLKTYYRVTDSTGTANIPVDYDHNISNGTTDVFQAIPSGQTAFEIQNTHKYMNYQIGYGRKFTLMDSQKAGELTYIVRADAGILMGAARSIVITPDMQWIENRDGLKVQGYNASIGSRLEWKPGGEKGKLSTFVEYKYSKLSDQKYQFLDGQAKAVGGDFSTVNFGVVLDILDLHKLKKKK